MTKTYIYSVAELYFTLSLPSNLDVDELLPSMKGFRVAESKTMPIFQARCLDEETLPYNTGLKPLEQTENDMGKVSISEIKDEYIISSSYIDDSYVHYLILSKDFRHVNLQIRWQDKNVRSALSSLLRIAFAQAVVLYGGVSIHGSTVVLNNEAYLFLGASGTGKSTHSSLWQQVYEECYLLNDDNPVIRLVGDEVKIYGTPWSGKTPCYKNEVCHLSGIVRLQQAMENVFQILHGIDAFIALLPSCVVLKYDQKLYGEACNIMSKIVGQSHVGLLKCLPNRAAAILCKESLVK